MASSSHQNASLYVGDLLPDVTEAMLFDLFKAVGHVLSIRVCRDAVTRRSLGYAYVNFQNPHDAERALETLNYHQVKGKPIRIMWSHRDPGLRKSGVGNVFIKNLHKSIDNQTLYDTFSQFGNILSCKVAVDSNNESRGYGFVHFESEESARAAIEKVNGMLLKSLQVYVGLFVRRSQRQQQTQQKFTNIFIKGLRRNVTQQEVVEYFTTFGSIKSPCLKHDKFSRPFACVDFDQHESAEKAVKECHQKPVPQLCEENASLYVARFQKKSEWTEELKKKFAQLRARRITEYSGSNLYVKNLDDTIDAKTLEEAFARFGEITSAVIMFDEKTPRQSKGFGFVCFKEAESANKAISEMNGHILGSKPLYVNVAQRKEVRRATLEIQYAARIARAPLNVPFGVPAAPMGYQPMTAPPPQQHRFFQPPAGAPYMYPPTMPRGAMGGPGPKWAQQPAMPVMPQFAQQMPMRGPPQGMRRIPGRAQAPRPSVPARGVPKPSAMAPGNFVYNKQVRNKDAIPIAGPTPGMGVPAHPAPGPAEPLTPAALAGMSPEGQKNALGERLFARICETHPDYAAKVTGMLLEMDVTETLNLLESPDVLHSKIEEALEVLKAHENQ